MNVAIPRELAQAIHDYLLTRPMGEVEPLVNGLRQSQPVDGDQPEPEMSDEPGD